MKNSNSPTNRRIASLTGAACIACCTVPILGIAMGSASIAGLAIYSEKAAIAALAIGLIVLLYRRFARKPAPSCDIDGSCNPNKQ